MIGISALVLAYEIYTIYTIVIVINRFRDVKLFYYIIRTVAKYNLGDFSS
jgi:hypothetical protein